MELGVIGLGKMGGNLSLQALDKQIRVVGLSASPIPKELIDKGLIIATDYADFTQDLAKPRKIILYVPAGPPVDAVLEDLTPQLDPGDIVMDGGNSYYRDSINRYHQLQEKGISFIDVGSSGGPSGGLNGACFMLGGDKKAVSQVLPILEKLAVPDGVYYAGPSGAGHFVKLVHNGIEFGMLQSIGEGFALLKSSEYQLNLADLFHNWNHGSVIRGWLIELMEKALKEGPPLDEINPYIEDTGEVNWLVSEAVCREIPIPVISQAVWELMQSRGQENNAYRAVSALRHQFGGHPFGPSESIQRERREGRVAPILCQVT